MRPPALQPLAEPHLCGSAEWIAAVADGLDTGEVVPSAVPPATMPLATVPSSAIPITVVVAEASATETAVASTS